jgi:hypothetical protein
LVASEVSTIITHSGANNPANPYGHGNDGNASEYISVGESWAEHVGRSMDDLQYGGSSNGFTEQGVNYFNNFIIPGSSHINYLEDFSPFRVNADPFHWIPTGIYWDLNDNRDDQNQFPVRVPINDDVFGYTNNQLFAALDNDVTSMPQYRIRLLQENSNNQSIQVTTLFSGYGY